ncbi:hypothetical protein [Bradyrhizobium sp. 174]|uniref:hypothetical protein n=1 Tax=Bradyrhizobium sp. 174 TaxID=2782645 RepID=UPI001FF95431|nr:hypothetical protein [Bradyrhizobium sp. 174]MCK1577007.1 hypothetical protein [Bradyrhizobium sp. 174]
MPSNWRFHYPELREHGALTPAEQIEQSYDDAMIALADYLTRDCDAETTVDRLLRILDRDSLRDALSLRSWSMRGCILGRGRMCWNRRSGHAAYRLMRNK